MAAKYNFSGNVQAGAIGDNSQGIFHAGNSIQIKTVDDFKASLHKLITELRTDPSIDVDILSSINFLKNHAGDCKSPAEAPSHWEKLKQCGGKVCEMLYNIGISAGEAAISKWITEGLKSLMSK